MLKRLYTHLTTPIPPHSLIAFRMLFGLFMAGSLIRFWSKGWITAFYVLPEFHFTYSGFSWIHPWPAWGMHLHVGLLIVFALCIAAGWFYRLSCTFFFLGFTYMELLDKTYYLNHYYAISLLSFLLIFLPLHQKKQLPTWALWTLRGQISIIYFFAGVAKLNDDWLFLAQPLKIWLSANTHLPGIGPLLGYPETAYLMSWVGMLYDLSVPFLLCLPKTRPFAYGAVIVFHLFTALLFSIGVFPWMMMVITLIFFEPDWPQKCYTRLANRSLTPLPHTGPLHTPRYILPALGVYFVIQVLLPFHYLLYPGSLFWTEQGFRFSWRVMLMEKNGMIDFKVTSPSTQKTWIISPTELLTPLQAKMMATQPDMILQFAHHLREKYKRYAPDIEVYGIHSYVSINGRFSQPYVNETVNLLTQTDPLFKPRTFLEPYKK